MSVRTYCDNCGKELSGASDNACRSTIESAQGGVMFRISAGFNKLHEGDVCPKCVIEAIVRDHERGRWKKGEASR